MSSDPWRHRGAGMRCGTCMWYVAKAAQPSQVADGDVKVMRQPPELGRCRRHAPTMQGFPAVFPADWCGDHRLDENKVEG